MLPVTNRNYCLVSVLVEALGTAKTRNVRCPVRGYVRRIEIVADVVTDDNNVITCSIQGTAITGGAGTLTTAHTAGLGLSLVPTAANQVLPGQSLQAATDGGGTVGQCVVTFLIETE